ncbi:MAG: tetratricopeptide repeat protein, partial [Planctomycetota bacterium]|nr:tetratricopeptide repeat protein [Planctomycetota bacterium]
LVHHARIAVDRSSASRRAAAADPQPGFDGMDLGTAENPDGHLLGWAPGRVARPFGDGMAWALEPGDDLVAQLHMVPSGRPEPVRFRLALYFTERPPVRRPVTVVLGIREIDIPAGEPAYEVRDDYVLPVAARATAIVPHAHYLGKTMRLTAHLPTGGSRSLLRIDDWDFNWQDEYHYAEPVRLPAGTRIAMRYTFDNSADNPRNPHIPPRRVVQGPRTVDEMAELALQWLPEDAADVELMERDARRQLATKAIRFRKKLLAANPRDVESLSALGSSWLEIDDPVRAVEPLTTAARLRPGDSKILNNLGFALERSGRGAEAVERYRHALSVDEELIEARRNLARSLRARGDWREAAGHLSRVLDGVPDDAAAAVDLAWILATHPDEDVRDPLRAKTLATRVVDGQATADPIALATLAAALAASGDFAGAVERAEEAVSAARALKQRAFESALQRQLDQYRADRAWVQRGVR